MTRAAQRSIVLALMLVLVGATAGRGAAPWPMLGCDAQRTGRSDANGPTTPTKLWEHPISGIYCGSPAVADDGTVYVAERNGTLTALAPGGTVKWTRPGAVGIYSAPAIAADGTVVFGAIDKVVYAVNPDGTDKWSYTTDWQISASPVIAPDGTIYCGSLDLFALNPDGTLRWRYPAGDGVGTAAIGPDGTIYFPVYLKGLVAVNPDGTLKWEFSVAGQTQGAPSVGDDGTIYFGTRDGSLYALNPDGTQRWAYDAPAGSGMAVNGDGVIYFTDGSGRLHAVNPDGTRKWMIDTIVASLCTPAIGADGTVYCGSWEKTLYAFNPDGTQKWTFTAAELFESAPAIGADGTIYVGTDLGTKAAIYAIGEASPPALAIAPATATLESGATQQFTATPADGVVWTCTGGAIDATGLFTAGAVLGTYTVTATLGTETATASIDVTNVPLPPTITPGAAALLVGKTQQFTATPAANITWTATGGTIDATGLFTAGTTPGDFTITATSPDGAGTATVTVTPAPPSATGTGQPDMMVRAYAGGPFIGLNYYGDPGAQGCTLPAHPERPVTFHIAVRNAERVASTFVLTGTAGNATWTVSFADEGGNDITAAITGGTRTVAVQPGEFVAFTCTVTPGLDAGSYSAYPVTVKAAVEAAPLRTDGVCLTTQVLPGMVL
jgi:outer membrane protein assembly factor BamB